MTPRLKIVHVLTRLDKGGSAEDTMVLVLGLADAGRDLVLIKGLSAESTMSPEEQRAVDEWLGTAAAKGVRVIELPSLVRRISPGQDLIAFWQLFQFFRRERPQIVHTHTSKAGIVGRLAAFLAGVKIIVHTPHGHVFHGYFSPAVTRIFIIIEQLFAFLTDRIIAVSDRELEEHLAVRVGNRNKIVSIPSAVDLARFIDHHVDIAEQKRTYGIPADHKVVGAIGRLQPIKGHKYLIEAAALVIALFPKTVFVLTGDGELRDELKKQAQDLGIHKNIIFIAWTSRVAEVLHTFDIFAFPSLNEGLGKVLVEAMAVQKPVVASAVGGILDLVVDGVNGILVPPKDSAQLAKGIIRLLSDKDLAARMGRNGRQHVYPAYDVRVRIKRVAGLYQELLQHKNMTLFITP